jgi:hypothetical protein
LLFDHAEQVQGVGVLVVEREYAAIAFGGGRELPLFVQGEGVAELRRGGGGGAGVQESLGVIRRSANGNRARLRTAPVLRR